MAYIESCIYCKGNVLNSPWHPECRADFYEDLLARIKKRLQDSPGASLPDELVNALLNEPFETKAERDERVRLKQELAFKKNAWITAKSDVLQRAIREWEEKNPDPNPPLY